MFIRSFMRDNEMIMSYKDMKSRAAMIANVMKVHDIWKNETILLQSCIHPESINIYNSREIFSI